eukprot:5949919-Amphidinium_carterae.1
MPDLSTLVSLRSIEFENNLFTSAGAVPGALLFQRKGGTESYYGSSFERVQTKRQTTNDSNSSNDNKYIQYICCRCC